MTTSLSRVQLRFWFWAFVLSFLAGATQCRADEPAFRFDQTADKVVVRLGSQPVAAYVFRDREIPRPYFTDVRTASGMPVTRHHPPREGIDATDHATLHPGIWLAFGDLNGADFWRNKAQVQHDGFLEAPQAKGPQAEFTVRNRYRSGATVVCTETCLHRFATHPSGWLLTYESSFSGDELFAFGDQEEMGLGVRIASTLTAKSGKGEIVNSRGQRNEATVWGQTADWCDYRGTQDGRCLGLLVMPDPQNFRPCWFHARDYGFLAANPFGRNAFTRQPKSRIEVKPGERFQLRFTVLIHDTPDTQPFDAQAAARASLDQLKP